jgi:hypothetical protein
MPKLVFNQGELLEESFNKYQPEEPEEPEDTNSCKKGYQK